MNKKIIIIILVITALIGGAWYVTHSDNAVNVIKNVSKTVSLPDKDEHGCILSDGYRFSSLLGECIKLAERGIVMTPKEDSLDQTKPAYAVFKSQTDYLIGELFIPGNATSTLLNFENGMWSDQDATYRMFKAGNNLLILDAGSTLIYGSDNP